MGIPDKPTPPGDNCLLCFDADETPSKVIISISDMKTGDLWTDFHDPAPNGSWVFDQDPLIPCRWHNRGPSQWMMALQYQSGLSTLGGYNIFPGRGFFGSESADCIKHFTNINTSPSGQYYYDGYMFVSTPELLVAAVSAIVPFFSDGAFFEVFPGPGKIVDIRYANKPHRQNVTVQFDASEL